MNKSARRCVFCTVSANWTSALWCGNVHRTHIISLVFEKVKLRLINLWEHITSKAKKKKKKKKKYYKQSWKYVNTAKIISKVTITLSLINSTRVKISILLVELSKLLVHQYFRSVKFHYGKETRLLTLVKIVLASQHKTQPNKSLSRFVDNWKHRRLGLESARAALCKWASRTCLSKTFPNSPNKHKQ